MKKLISLLMLVLVMVSLTACLGEKTNDITNEEGSDDTIQEDVVKDESNTEGEDNSLQYILDKGELILGLDDAFPPMGFRDENEDIVGFDIDLAQAVAEKLGVELKLQPIVWDANVMELNTKNIDCIWNGFSITTERLESLTMSIPYMENTIALVVPNDSEIASLNDMAGKKLALQGGSSAEETLNLAENKEFKDSLSDVIPFGDYTTALMDLETGNSDAVLMDSVVANYMINDAGKKLKVLDDVLIAEEYAIGFRKGEQALTDAVNKALKELKEDGTLAEISNKWFGFDNTTVE